MEDPCSVIPNYNQPTALDRISHAFLRIRLNYISADLHCEIGRRAVTA